MPQGRRPTAEEVLGIAPRRPTAEEVLGLPPRRPSAEEVLGLQPQEPPRYSYEWFRRQLGLGAEFVGQKVRDIRATIQEADRATLEGDFRPLVELGERAGRGAVKTFSTRNTRDPATGKYLPTVSQDARLAELKARQEARLASSEEGAAYLRESQANRARLEAEAARDPSLAARVVRGVPQMAPYLLTGGNPLALAATSAVMSLDEPERMAGNVALSVAPLPPVGAAFRAGREAVRRVLGRGAEQIVELESRQAVSAPVRGAAGAIRSMGPVEQQAAISAGRAGSAPFSVGPAASPSAGLNAAISQAAAQVPQSTARRILNEVSAFPRAMMSSLDISAPGRQGLLLSAAPSRWGAAVRAGREMFQAFKPESYERITKEIANHADAAVAEKSGLYLALRGAAEELFTSKLAAKVPGVVRSQRMYETYLDSLRMSTFSQYRRLIDKAGLSAADSTRAYEAAAKWINYATGRGSLGKKFDDAVPLLSQFLFAPRYTASRFNVLNPVMYYRNFKDPATRVVAKQQMKDLAQYLGAVALTMGLAKAAGLDVGLNPSKGDFLKIRWGTKVYDPGAGLVQVMRFAIRTGMDFVRAGEGEKAEWGQDAVGLTERFIRSKLAPLPSYAWDFFSRRTYTGQEFTTAGQRAKGALERVAPLTWSDFVEALWNEGIGEAAKTLPGALGIGVQSYAEPGGFIEQAAPLLREYTRAGRQIPEIRRLKDEGEQQFNARLKVFGEALSRYGAQLVESQEYRQADTATKDKALDLLPRRISSALIKQGESWQLAPRVLMSDVRENLELRRELEREQRRK